MKKLLCLFMVICMAIGSAPAFAEEAEKTIPDTWELIYDWRNNSTLFWAEINGEICTIKAVAQYSGDELVVPYKENLCVKVDSVHSTIGDPLLINTILIEKGAFEKGAEMVKTITFEEGYQGLPDGLCKGLYNLTTVNLPESLCGIGKECFKHCVMLENINLENVQNIDRSAFEGCLSLKSITLSDKINAIEDYAFKDCESLEKVEGLNENISIGKDAFLGTKVVNEDIKVTEKEPLYSDIDNASPYSEAVNVLAKLGIISGYDDRTFKPDVTLTRAEAAAIIVRLLNLEINLAGGETSFSDVAANHWASGYIEWATENGIINGQGDGTFAPEEFVTEHQLIKMLVCTLGYEPLAMANGGWMNGGYITAAEQIGLIEKDSLNKNVHIKRGEAALLCYNALDIDFMEEIWYNCTGMGASGYKILEGKNILTECWYYEKIEGVIKNSAGKLLIKVTKTYADKSDYVVGQVFTFEDERLGEFVDSSVTAYVKKTADAKNELLFAKK